jgi:hypothetical protein
MPASKKSNAPPGLVPEGKHPHDRLAPINARDGWGQSSGESLWFMMKPAALAVAGQRLLQRMDIPTAYRPDAVADSLLKKGGTGSKPTRENAAKNNDREVPVPLFHKIPDFVTCPCLFAGF